MSKSKIELGRRRSRTIKWDEETDKKAEFLAFEEHRKGGVSEELAALVRAKWDRKYPGQLPSQVK